MPPAFSNIVWDSGFLPPAQGGDRVDTLAEWLRRRPAKPVGSARVGSNPTGVASLNFCVLSTLEFLCSCDPRVHFFSDALFKVGSPTA